MDNLIVGIAFTKFPRKFTCDGDDVSPAIRIGRIGAPYLAVILNDPDAPGGTFNHWVM